MQKSRQRKFKSLRLCSGARRGEPKPARGSNFAHWSGMPGAKCRVKHLSKEMPGARRRMEEHGGLPPLPDRGSHGRPESPWSRSPNTCGSDRSSTPPPIDPYARSSPVPTTVEEPVAAPTRGEPTGWDKNSGGHKARELGARMNTLRRQETKKLMDGAVYAKKHPKSIPLWFFEKYKIITNSCAAPPRPRPPRSHQGMGGRVEIAAR